MAFILFEREMHILNSAIKNNGRFLHPHTDCGGFVFHKRPPTQAVGVVLKRCLHACCPFGDCQGPPSPQQLLPWKPAPQGNDPFEPQRVGPSV